VTSPALRVMDSCCRCNDIVSNVTLQMTMSMEMTAVRLFAEGAVVR
jgi:hypothetical protein